MHSEHACIPRGLLLCLRMPVVQDGTNLVYCAPTSGGKSMVAEILLLRQLLAHMPGGEHYQKPRDRRQAFRQPLPRAMLILPFVRCETVAVQRLWVGLCASMHVAPYSMCVRAHAYG